MKENKPSPLIPLLLIGAMLFSFFTLSVFSAPSGVSAKAAALYEPMSGTFLYTKNADVRLPMASTTKIMTALLLCEAGELQKTVRVPKEAVGVEGSSLYLKTGDVISRADLLYGILLRSANDAATAAAIAVSGSVPAFVDRMNERAAALGLCDTHFENPHGLHADTHYTTAKDLALLAAAAMEDPTFREVCSTVKRTVDYKETLLVNHNKLLRLYDGAIGVKTGFTKRSGRCLVSAAERGGLCLIGVTLDAPDDWRDHTALFDFGFSTREMRRVRAGTFSYEIPVADRPGKTVTVENEDFSYVTDKSAPDYEAHVRLCRYVIPPIDAGDALGEVVLTEGDRVVGQIPLIASEGVGERNAKRKNTILK